MLRDLITEETTAAAAELVDLAAEARGISIRQFVVRAAVKEASLALILETELRALEKVEEGGIVGLDDTLDERFRQIGASLTRTS